MQVVREPGALFLSYPNDRAVSLARGTELRAHWLATFDDYSRQQNDDEVWEEWAVTFAPEHPEWFAEENQPLPP